MWVNHRSANFVAICRRFHPPLVSRPRLELVRPATSCYSNRIRAGRQLGRVDSDRARLSATSPFRLSCSINSFFRPFIFLCSSQSVTNFTRVTSHVFTEKPTSHDVPIGTSNKLGCNPFARHVSARFPWRVGSIPLNRLGDRSSKSSCLCSDTFRRGYASCDVCQPSQLRFSEHRSFPDISRINRSFAFVVFDINSSVDICKYVGCTDISDKGIYQSPLYHFIFPVKR